MFITVNGECHQTTARTAADLLKELQFPQTGIAVALDGEVIRKSQLSQTIIVEGAKLEIVRAVQGG